MGRAAFHPPPRPRVRVSLAGVGLGDAPKTTGPSSQGQSGRSPAPWKTGQESRAEGSNGPRFGASSSVGREEALPAAKRQEEGRTPKGLSRAETQRREIRKTSAALERSHGYLPYSSLAKHYRNREANWAGGGRAGRGGEEGGASRKGWAWAKRRRRGRRGAWPENCDGPWGKGGARGRSSDSARRAAGPTSRASELPSTSIRGHGERDPEERRGRSGSRLNEEDVLEEGSGGGGEGRAAARVAIAARPAGATETERWRALGQKSHRGPRPRESGRREKFGRSVGGRSVEPGSFEGGSPFREALPKKFTRDIRARSSADRGRSSGRQRRRQKPRSIRDALRNA
ncbi:hypothetical protein KM043_000192 [Ampulex compressa]|nr:hypothetical protein KM043_000192 [Ampulex compressa]